MKRVMVGLIVGALCCTLLATPAYPVKEDPTRPPQTPYSPPPSGGNSSGDDTGWDSPDDSPEALGHDVRATVRAMLTIYPVSPLSSLLYRVMFWSKVEGSQKNGTDNVPGTGNCGGASSR
jgi:hypothetical protein